MGVKLKSMPIGSKVVLQSMKNMVHLLAVLVKHGVSERCGLFRIVSMLPYLENGDPANGNSSYKIDGEYWFGEEEVTSPERYQVWG